MEINGTTITLIGVVGGLTIFLSVLSKVWGFPDQFIKNYRRKSTTGLSFVLAWIIFLSYAFWTWYGYLDRDPVILLGQGLGVLVTGAILIQFYLYRKKK